MLKKHLIILNVVGLSPSLVSEQITPHLQHYAQKNDLRAMEGVFPALTTTAQSSMLTGLMPSGHGIVGNGWYDREYAEVGFWKQSNHLVKGEKLWQAVKKKHRDFRCSQLFWWYNMYAGVEASMTPRPHYPADGRKIIDLYSTPRGLHQKIEKKLGKFPFFNFWGPKAGIQSSRWIAHAAKLEFSVNKPNVQLVYLPHLDFCLQKFGPGHSSIAAELAAIDEVVGDLLAFYQEQDADVLVVSEYGIQAVELPIHINRVLREKGLITVRDSLTWELLDPGASEAFAVADHQIAHVYVKNKNKLAKIRQLLQSVEGIDEVLDEEGKKRLQVNHARAGDLIAIAAPNAWFTYYYWLDDSKAPDFAHTVDIHRKPGFDPAEMFFDPAIVFPEGKVAWRLLQKTLGFRMLMDVTPIHAEMVGGSHGRLPDSEEEGALVILPRVMANRARLRQVKMTGIKALVQGYFDY